MSKLTNTTSIKCNLRFISTGLYALLAALGVSMQSLSASISIYTSGHADIGVEYDSVDGFEPHWHVGSGATVDGTPLAVGAEYAPADLLAQVSSTRFSPTGSMSILGIADGSSIYVAGASSYQPNLGISAEELSISDWTEDITLTLTGWSLPTGAEFALYSTNLAGTSVTDTVFSTFAPAETFANNLLSIVPGDHMHFEWAFTQLGSYELTFQWEGTHVHDGAITGSETFGFSVVPEPSTYALILLSVVGCFVLIRRRFSTKAIHRL